MKNIKHISHLMNQQLLVQNMPYYHIRNVHQTICKANIETTFQAIKNLTYSELGSTPGSILMKFRRVLLKIIFPKRHFRKSTHRHRRQDINRPILNFNTNSNWGMLGEIKNQEVLVGFIGQFWQPSPKFVNYNGSVKNFHNFSEKGYAKAVLDFYVAPISEEYSKVIIETRVRCLDYRSFKDMKIYWTIISPGIWFVRKMWLLAIKKRAEYHQKLSLSN